MEKWTRLVNFFLMFDPFDSTLSWRKNLHILVKIYFLTDALNIVYIVHTFVYRWYFELWLINLLKLFGFSNKKAIYTFSNYTIVKVLSKTFLILSDSFRVLSLSFEINLVTSFLGFNKLQSLNCFLFIQSQVSPSLPKYCKQSRQPVFWTGF